MRNKRSSCCLGGENENEIIEVVMSSSILILKKTSARPVRYARISVAQISAHRARAKKPSVSRSVLISFGRVCREQPSAGSKSMPVHYSWWRGRLYYPLSAHRTEIDERQRRDLFQKCRLYRHQCLSRSFSLTLHMHFAIWGNIKIILEENRINCCSLPVCMVS